MSGELWLAEGFTQYYGQLIMARAGLSAGEQTLLSLANSALGVASSPAHRFRSAVEMSQMAPFTDAARANDPTNFGYSFINYYPYGSALALALDLSLRQRSGGKVTLDDYMRGDVAGARQAGRGARLRRTAVHARRRAGAPRRGLRSRVCRRFLQPLHRRPRGAGLREAPRRRRRHGPAAQSRTPGPARQSTRRDGSPRCAA